MIATVVVVCANNVPMGIHSFSICFSCGLFLNLIPGREADKQCNCNLPSTKMHVNDRICEKKKCSGVEHGLC